MSVYINPYKGAESSTPSDITFSTLEDIKQIGLSFNQDTAIALDALLRLKNNIDRNIKINYTVYTDEAYAAKDIVSTLANAYMQYTTALELDIVDSTEFILPDGYSDIETVVSDYEANKTILDDNPPTTELKFHPNVEIFFTEEEIADIDLCISSIETFLDYLQNKDNSLADMVDKLDPFISNLVSNIS